MAREPLGAALSLAESGGRLERQEQVLLNEAPTGDILTAAEAHGAVSSPCSWGDSEACPVLSLPSTGGPHTACPVLAPFASLSHTHPLLPGPGLTSLINDLNQNPCLQIGFWGNAGQAASFYEARVSEHRDACGLLSHCPRQEIPVSAVSGKQDRLEGTGLRTTGAPGQKKAPPPHT